MVIVEAKNYEPWKRRVRVNRGQNKVLTVELRTTKTRDSLRMKGYLSVGAAALFAVAGAYYGIKESNAREEANDIFDTETTRPSLYDEESEYVAIRTRQSMEDAVARAKSAGTLSNLSLGLAAVAVGASLYFFLQERPVEREGLELPVAIIPILPSHGTASVGAQLTFTKELNS